MAIPETGQALVHKCGMSVGVAILTMKFRNYDEWYLTGIVEI